MVFARYTHPLIHRSSPGMNFMAPDPPPSPWPAQIMTSFEQSVYTAVQPTSLDSLYTVTSRLKGFQNRNSWRLVPLSPPLCTWPAQLFKASTQQSSLSSLDRLYTAASWLAGFLKTGFHGAYPPPSSLPGQPKNDVISLDSTQRFNQPAQVDSTQSAPGCLLF